MVHPAAWAQLLAAGEITFGMLLLAGGRAARLGWACVIGFHILLLLFGWGVWAYAVPALALLVWLARRDLRGGLVSAPGAADAGRRGRGRRRMTPAA